MNIMQEPAVRSDDFIGFKMTFSEQEYIATLVAHIKIPIPFWDGEKGVLIPVRTHAHQEDESTGNNCFVASLDSALGLPPDKDIFDGRQRDGDKW